MSDRRYRLAISKKFGRKSATVKAEVSDVADVPAKGMVITNSVPLPEEGGKA